MRAVDVLFGLGWVGLFGFGLFGLRPQELNFWVALNPGDPPPLDASANSKFNAKPDAKPDAKSFAQIEVPFCLQLRGGSEVIRAADCEKRGWFQHSIPICGWQNLDDTSWRAKIVESDPAVVASAMIKVGREIGCHVFVIDIESVVGSEAAHLTPWLLSLTREIKHHEPRIQISIPVYAKTSDVGLWDGPASQNWHSLCSTADEILVMAYDYSTPEHGQISDVAPLNWVQDVLGYAITQCPREKIRLGLAAFGYNWKNGKTVSERDYAQDANLRADPMVKVETLAMRKEKVAYAEKLGVRKYFLWSQGMAAQ